ncbi:transposase [Nostoc sp. PA-18-2419]|uniref:transposase n=1 Tax=Nostoc sp. PA-18-2419 TaxID=2575443 RepID=UPI0011087A69|nr:transposase [Nostoc sp. PA-18-2419]
MALFPPGSGGGEDVAYGGNEKGVLIHTLTQGNGMPLANCTTPANGNEREQVLPLLEKVKLKTLKPGRPRKRVKVLATDKGYDSKDKRAALRKRGIRPQRYFG